MFVITSPHVYTHTTHNIFKACVYTGNSNAAVGIVKTKVTGKVNRFDMLTTSSKAGYAEKAAAADFGSIIGKAMEPCSGECIINVLVGLR